MGNTTVKNAMQFEALPTSTASPTASSQFITNTYANENYVASNYGASYTGTLLLNAIPISYTLRGLFLNGSVVSSVKTVKLYMTGTQATLLTLDLGSAEILDTFSMTAAALTSVTGSSIKYVIGALSGTYNALTTFSFPQLITTTVGFSVNSTSLTTLSLPQLTNIGGALGGSLASLTTFSMPNLQYVFGSVSVTYAALTTLSLPSLISVSTTFTISAVNLVNFSFGSTLKNLGGNLTMTGAKLSQASVDNILVTLAALDGTNGTTAFSSKTINVSGGTSSAPSATGLTAKATLQARSCTVTTN